MHIKDHATAQGWFRKHAAAPSSVGSWKAFVARNKRGQEPRNMAEGGVIGKPGGIVEPGVEYYSTSKVYNEKTGHIYKKGNRFNTVYSKTPTLNQHKVNLKDPKYTEEVIKFIDENPTFNQKQGIKSERRIYNRCGITPLGQIQRQDVC